ncbi:MAG: acyl-CoA desaturase [Acidimicrobiales bacterium]
MDTEVSGSAVGVSAADPAGSAAGVVVTAADVAVAAEEALAPPGQRWRSEPKNWWMATPFLAMHLAPIAAIWTGVPWRDLVVCAVLYFGRMFFITAGYHRYFSHRTYKMGRVPQFVMALGGITAVQKGPLWWGGHHREHHRYGDTDRDPHSPQQGFWWSHIGWILSRRYKATNYEIIEDFARYPELRLVNRFQLAGPMLLGVACWWFFGWAGVVVGFVWSTVLLWHGTFVVNSVTHLVGRRRYATPDTSRNSFLVALATNGEGWHNNHHHYPASARQGFFWWEWDPSYYALWVLERVGLVGDLRRPPPATVRARRTGDGTFDIGMFRAFLGKAARLSSAVGALTVRPVETPAPMVNATTEGPSEAALPSGPSGLASTASGAAAPSATMAGATMAGATVAAVAGGTVAGTTMAGAAVAEAQRRLAEALAEVAARAKELTRASRPGRERT